MTRDHVADFITYLIEARSSSTASVRFRSLQQFFGWLDESELAGANPMERMRPPMVPERPVPVLTPDKLRAPFATCTGNFIDRRDEAILRLFTGTGLRLSELAHLRVADVDLDEQVAVESDHPDRHRFLPVEARCIPANAVAQAGQRACGGHAEGRAT